jgi:hypothetical protein
MRTVKYFALAVLAVAVASAGVFRADDKKDDPKYTIKDVMKMAHQADKDSKDPTLAKKVTDGKGSKEDKAKLLELYTALAANKPPKGDADAWKKQTTTIVDAAKAVVDGKDGAEKDLGKAINCMACHKDFKPAK